MARPGKLDDEKVRQIRSIYASAREYSEDVGPDDEGYQTVTQTEERLAETFGVSQPMIRRIVLGLSYASVDGPLDERRRATAKEVLDEKPPKSVRVTIQRPGGSAKSYVHPPGTQSSSSRSSRTPIATPKADSRSKARPRQRAPPRWRRQDPGS